MIVRELSFTYKVHDGVASLSPSDQSLIGIATDACQKAYAPYSKFKVGVAMQTADQLIIMGSNQENGAFPIGQCAERVALYQLVHQHGRKTVDTIAIVVDNDQLQSPASPCGSCRQLLTEYRDQQAAPLRVLLALARGGEIVEIQDIRDLLPFAFDGQFLGQ